MLRSIRLIMLGMPLIFLSSCQTEIFVSSSLSVNNGSVTVENRTDRIATIRYEQERIENGRVVRANVVLELDNDEDASFSMCRFINSGVLTVTVDGVEEDITVFWPDSSAGTLVRLRPRDFGLGPILKALHFNG